jgi:zinc finger HIT domain-containing protein 1
MPLIEELPTNTTARASHGWTYVPDTGAPISAVQLGPRKRGRDGNPPTNISTIKSGANAGFASGHKLTAKQEKALQTRLDDLNKENHRENVNIPVPKRDVPKSKERKTTQNVRRILTYSRTFQHYLADEEAGVSVYGGQNISGPATARTAAVTKKAEEAKKKGAPKEAAPVVENTGSTRRTGRTSRTSIAAAKQEAIEDTDMPDAPEAPSSPQTSRSPTSTRHKTPGQPSSPTTEAKPDPPYDPSLDNDPLLKTLTTPKLPSAHVMEALLAEPPLSYKAARAKPLSDAVDGSSFGSGFTRRIGNNTLTAKPQRWFCGICGYWGKLRCRFGCGERVCGLLECVKGHEGVCTAAAARY